jgi:hypothetical protein
VRSGVTLPHFTLALRPSSVATPHQRPMTVATPHRHKKRWERPETGARERPAANRPSGSRERTGVPSISWPNVDPNLSEPWISLPNTTGYQ